MTEVLLGRRILHHGPVGATAQRHSLVMADIPDQIGAVEAEVRHSQHHDYFVCEGLQTRELPESDDDED